MTLCADLEELCICGHAWWSHLAEVGGCYARNCDCKQDRPECRCDSEPA